MIVLTKLVAVLRKWADFVKISHTVFALPFALAAMVVAARENKGWPGWRTFLLILAAMVSARTCAMSFNRIVDRKFDAANPRTAGRHLPTGAISLFSAWTLWAVGAAGLVAVSWLLGDGQPSRICFYLSPVALFIVCFYSLTKRFTDYTHVWLGIALALAPIGAWLAVKGSFVLFPPADGLRLMLEHSALLPLLLAVAVVFWLVGFDIIYALQDYHFDRAHGLHSLVVAWGPVNALRAAFLAHLVMWVVLVVFGFLAGFRLAYLVGMVLIIGCLVMEHWLAWRRSLNWIQNAFFHLNALVSVIFLTVTVAEVAMPWFRLWK